jgi:hypothetical protein
MSVLCQVPILWRYKDGDVTNTVSLLHPSHSMQPVVSGDVISRFIPGPLISGRTMELCGYMTHGIRIGDPCELRIHGMYAGSTGASIIAFDVDGVSIRCGTTSIAVGPTSTPLSNHFVKPVSVFYTPHASIKTCSTPPVFTVRVENPVIKVSVRYAHQPNGDVVVPVDTLFSSLDALNNAMCASSALMWFTLTPTAK